MNSTSTPRAIQLTVHILILVISAGLVTISVRPVAIAVQRLPSDPPPWPTTATVLKEFSPPWPDWLPGHRGLDLLAVDGGAVRTPISGIVAWRGKVGGTPVVVITHGIARATYQPVSGSLPTGTPIASGQVIGRMTAGGHCDQDCLHWGLKIDERYLDPRILRRQLHPVLISEPSRGSR